ncbi:MAG: molybdopterin-binding protein [Acidobacteria bacterium]|nr:molybdopterin-binding protein [Acidobacteriota bacterium]
MKLTQRNLIFLLATVLLLALTAFGQKLNPSSLPDSSITVSGEIEHPLTLSAADLSQFPRQSVQAKDHDGKEGKYEGIALNDILQKAGIKFGKELKGKALATYLLVEAADGYQAVFALPELDPAFSDRVVVLADRRDDNPLGSWQIIVPGEKRHSRWVRQVKSLIILRASSKTK